jgi:hypothetical protein
MGKARAWRQSVTVQPRGMVMTYNAKRGGMRIVQPPVRAVCTSTMANGPFAGRLPKDVAREAVEWWRDYLDRVDREADVMRRRP